MADTPKRSRLRRAFRGVIWTVLSVLLGVTVLALIAVVVLFTTPGQSYLRKFALEKVNDSIAGTVQLGKLDLDVGGWIRLRDVRLLDPKGREVLRADLLAAHVDALALVEHRIWVKDVELKRPEVHILAREDGGNNLTDAVTARHPSPKQPEQQPSTGKPWRIELDRLALKDGLVDRRLGPDDPNALHIQDLQLGGSAVDLPGRVVAELHGGAVVTSPEKTPVGFEIEARGTGFTLDDRLEIKKLEVVAGHSSLVASGGIENQIAQGKLSVRLDRTLGRSMGVPLAQDLVADGEATWRKGVDARVDLAVPEGEKGLAFLHAVVAPEATPMRYSASLKLDHFDPAALVTTAPKGSLNGTVRVAGRGTSLPELVADVDAKLQDSQVNGIAVSALDLSGRVAGEKLTLEKLSVVMPGGRFDGRGTASMHALDLALTAQVPDLKAFTSNLGVDPPYEGSAQGSVRLGGTPTAPSLVMALASPRFANPAINLDLREVSIDAQIPDLRQPTTLSAKLRAARGSFQEQGFQAFDGAINLGSGRFKADLHSAGEAALTLRASGELPNDAHVMTLATLDIGQGDTAWTLSGPARLDLGRGARVDRLELRSGDQKLVAQGGLTRNRIDAHLELQHVDLARLPKLAVPARLGLKGIIDGSADVRGSKSDPEVQAHLQAKGLAAAALSARTQQTVDLSLEASLLHHRARGHARGDFAGEQVALDFDAPVTTKARADAPLAVRLHARDVQLVRLADVLNVSPRDLAGRVDLDAAVEGTLANPRGTATLTARSVKYQNAPPLDGSVKLDFDHAAKLALDLRAPEGGLKGTAEIALPDDLVRHPERAKELRTRPLSADLALKDFALDPWRAVFGIPPDASGVVDASLVARGSAADPRGNLHLEVHKLVYGKYKNLDAVADLGAADVVSLRGQLALRGRSAGRLDARLERSLATLISDPSRAGSAPVSATVEMGPLDLAQAQGPKPTAHGTASFLAELRGTLDKPVLHAHASGRQLSFSSAPLGEAEASLVYQDGALRLRAAMDRFSLDAGAQQDLGLAALRRGLNVKTIPIELDLRADKFELAELSGASEAVSTLGGQLSANAHLTGSIADPTFRGQLQLTDGRIVLAGFGDYRQIAVKLSADNRNIQLSQCELHSGGGWAKLTAGATRSSDAGPFALTGELHSDKFPIDNEDQTLGFLQSDAKIDGEVGGRDSLVNVRFSSVHADIPKLTRKDVQPLAPNPDIMVLGRTEKAHKPAKQASLELQGAVAEAAGPVPTPAPDAPGMQVRLGIFAPSNFWLRGQDINVEVHAALGVRLRPGATQMVEMIPPPGRNEASHVEVARGYISVVGRRFDVDESKPPKIVFEGGAPQNAQLDASLNYNDRQDNILVTVTITGPMTKPNPPTLTSQPPMDPSQLALLIATGHLTAKRGAGQVSATSQAGSVVGSFLAGQVQQAMAKTLPIDTVTVQTNSQGEISAEVGKYITDKIYVGYTRNFASQLSPGSLENQDQNINEVTLQYQLTPHWQLEAVGGETQGGVDAIWQKDY